jgi:rare lipoprotein A (peptidoglycan hydrolase)
MGSHVRVTNLANGRSVVVRINDRGPFVHGRRLDLSHAAAERIGMDREGIGKVRISRLDDSSGERIFVPGSSPDPESYAELDKAPSGATHHVWGEHPREWIGRVKMSLLQSQYSRRSSRHYHTKTVSDPIGTWLMSALPHP